MIQLIHIYRKVTSFSLILYYRVYRKFFQEGFILQMMSMNATKTPHPASMVQRVAILPLVLLPVTVLVLVLKAPIVKVKLDVSNMYAPPFVAEISPF